MGFFSRTDASFLSKAVGGAVLVRLVEKGSSSFSLEMTVAPDLLSGSTFSPPSLLASSSCFFVGGCPYTFSPSWARVRFPAIA